MVRAIFQSYVKGVKFNDEFIKEFESVRALFDWYNEENRSSPNYSVRLIKTIKE